MNKEIIKVFNNLSKRLFRVEKKLETFLLDKHYQNKEKIETSDGGIMDIADILSLHDEVICELAEVLSSIVEGESLNG